MKKNEPEGEMFYRSLKKTLMIMRNASLLLLIGILQAYAVESFSQKTRLSLEFKDMELIKVLDSIEAESEYYFLYNEKLLDTGRKVNISADNQPIDKILDNLFAGTDVRHTIVDRKIILAPDYLLSKSDIKALMQQQQITVTGKVTDSQTGEPIAGVNVVVKGTTTGTMTDASGSYLLNVPDRNATLVFSFVGYTTQEIPLAGRTSLNVSLVSEAIGLEEVVVVGYGTQRKVELTSAISSVKSDNFIKGSIRDAAQLIKGQVAGVNIINPNSDPTATSQILLRGVTTLASGTQPLVIIDGVPGSLKDVAPEDIESIDILKDGSAAAIYGTRGTNGVMIVTTRKIKAEMPPTIEWNSFMSTQVVTKYIEMMDAEDIRRLASQGKPGAFDYGSNTNWIDEIFRTPISQTHNVNIKGGSINNNYIINVNYKALQGLMLKSDNNIFNTRIEANHSMFDGKLKFNANLVGYEQKYFSGAAGQHWRADVYRYALIYNPTDPVKDSNGKWTEHLDNNYRNPVALIMETDGEINEINFRPFGTLTFTPIKGLTFKVLGSHNLYKRNNNYYETSKNVQSILSNRKGYAQKSSSTTNEDLLEVTTNYLRSFNKHNINLLGGYTYNEVISESLSANNYDFPSDFYSYNNLSLGSARTSGLAGMSSSKSSSRLVGYFARANYNYDERYLLMASIRYEGSTKFGENNKWGAFPSVSAGWNIIRESFMKNIPIISALKIRAGIGVTGTVPSSSYQSLARLSYGSKILFNGSWIPVINPSSNNNPGLGWERKEEVNVGFEIGFFDNRIFGTIDFYNRTTKDLLWNYNVATPPYLYSTIFANAGTMENKGIEIQITGNPVRTSTFNWNSTVNFSTNKNKLVSLSSDQFQLKSGYFYTGSTGEPIQTTTHRVEEGQPIGNFWGYKSIDIDDNGRWIIEGADGKPKPIAEQQPTDKKVLGNGLPKYYLSWINSFTYNKFDLNITMNGAFGFQILNFMRMFFSVPISLTRGNVMKNTYDNIYGKRPLSDSQELQYVSYYIENGDYWKISNIDLGYNLDFKSGLIRFLRIYVSGYNMFTFTGYSGIDPEVNSIGLYPGNDERDRYPNAREYTFGILVRF